jgi:osmoprotectant transport system permease protein
MRRRGADKLLLSAVGLAALLLGLPHAAPLFHWLFPDVERPLYRQDSFARLALDHTALVIAASAIAAMVGIGAAVAVTRGPGRAFRPLLETLAAIGQTVPPVGVLALAVPALGFGVRPAVLALALYGLLPIVQAALAGLDGVPAAVRDAADGIGFGPWRRLLAIDLPLAAPLILAGVRTTVVINVGTAAIASTIGVRTLGTPIILGLDGNNTAYVLQGAVLVALLALVLDQAIGWVARRAVPAR